MMALAVTPTPVPTAIRPASSFDSTRISASCPPERNAAFMFATSSGDVYLLTLSVNGRVRPAMRPPMPTTVPCMVSPAAAFAFKTFAYDADATQHTTHSRHRNVLLFMLPPVRSPARQSGLKSISRLATADTETQRRKTTEHRTILLLALCLCVCGG